ncbi:uncharacterized protein PGTG_22387 [Puccinia graminis f. sp. tritici CRL 75-36-700-3]|uniref:Uncharacterized protein n=1 Tax=Puccinia graminis f. sp. tritici (strain CRL 75-36-700-3 / race SCCL) TaxID=418459 RepID=H6QUD6_PUCGT|nr:uncharacterized protein PGTG_22387 [Puccinia graminis f. sp. tritici CRL 75-36-700-3]EHS64599.1 hypothetical protein PGTG_22387 [Puccinia graminis f. sp. tritici CRL 75-36-700-3]
MPTTHLRGSVNSMHSARLTQSRPSGSFIRWLAGGTWTLSGIKLATGTGGGRSRSSTAQILLRFSNAQLQHLGPRDGAIDT